MNASEAANGNKQGAEANLAGRYGKIGIPALAAALRYQTDYKNPAYAPAVPHDDTWLMEKAAA